MTRGRWLLFAAIIALLAATGASVAFSRFMAYDDEGYVLLSLKNFAEHGGLYDQVYTQYGPFFFVFHAALHALGLDFTNIAARLLALAWWTGSVAFCGALVWRVTRSTTATVYTFGGVFLYLWHTASEPSHPGGMIALGVSIVAWAGIRWADQPRRVAALTGGIGAALLLTKINVGVFLAAGVGAWWALHLAVGRITPGVRTAVVAVGLALLPLGLMQSQFGTPWVRTFAAIVIASATAIVIAGGIGTEARLRASDILPGVLVGALVAAGTAASVMAQGTTFGGLVDGVLLGPLRQPLSYMYPVRWRPGALTLAGVALVTTAWATLRPSGTVSAAVAAARLCTLLAFLVCWFELGPVNLHAFAMSYGIATAVFFVLPLGGDRATQTARTWLALIFVMQSLHAYPVAGSQIGWGTFLWVPLAAIGGHDLVRWSADVFSHHRVHRHQWVALTVSLLIGAGIIGRCAWYGWLGQQWLRHGDSLRLPGATLLRLPEHVTTTLRMLALNASAHADVLFTLPGLNSFHLWTEIPPPTLANATLWFTLLSPAQQADIRRRLEAAPRSCVIVQRTLYDFLIGERITIESPLTVWLHENYEAAFALDGYEFWVRKGRRIAILNTALLETAETAEPRYRISILLAEAELRKVATIELAVFDGGTSTKVTSWSGDDAEVTVTPINSAGVNASKGHRAGFPFDAAGLVRLQLRTNRFPADFPLKRGVLHFRDATGRQLAEARFLN